MLGRHAYLIMCHTNFDQLKILLDLLDDERNDLYLHIDKKAAGYSTDEIKQTVKKSNLFFITPMNASWGGDSLVRIEIRLLIEATKVYHDYYHLISGMDLPIKTQDEIHSFFSQHPRYDFVSLERDCPHNHTKNFMDRINYYYFFQNIIEKNKVSLSSKLQNASLIIQKKLKICRTKNITIEFQKGAQWFSITHKTACYVVNEYKKYKNIFRFTFCPDEIFLQTILLHSPQINTIIDDDLRYIDWKRGEPYTFRLEDYDLLIHSEKLFARKFNSTVDEAIIYKIRDAIYKKTK